MAGLGEEPSYIDYETFLSPDFSPATFANSLVIATNNPSDTPLDLSTPLSKVLFDTQEIDSHIDLLTSRSAIPLLEYTRDQTESSKRIVSELDGQIQSLKDSYKQLEKEVIAKHAEADDVRAVATRLWEALKLGRCVGRCLQLGRQLEIQHSEISGSSTGTGKREDHRALVRCTHTILSLREVIERRAPGEEEYGLERVDAIRSLHEVVLAPVEGSVREISEGILRDFWIPSTATYAQGEEAKARLVSGLLSLYLLSPINWDSSEKWSPKLLLQSLVAYLRAALQFAITGLARSLSQLSTLERALNDISLKCQNIVALEAILDVTRAPPHPLLTSTPPQKLPNLLQPLLSHLETGSLTSYFWRSTASSLGTRVQEIVNRGGVAAKTLRSRKETVGDAVRECVLAGCQLPNALSVLKRNDGQSGPARWDREVAVMVGSIVNNLGR